MRNLDSAFENNPLMQHFRQTSTLPVEEDVEMQWPESNCTIILQLNQIHKDHLTLNFHF